MSPSAIDDGGAGAGPSAQQQQQQQKTYPAAKIFPVREARIEKFLPPQADGHELAARARSADSGAIVIDNGSSAVRAGWSFESAPRVVAPPVMAKFRDRRVGKTYTFAGTDCFYDATSRSHIKNAFETGTGIVTNWDVMEQVLDYIFIKLGLNGRAGGGGGGGDGPDGPVDVPIVMTEALANLAYSRKNMTELLFECYRVPSVAFGTDSLFSYRHNGGTTGIVVSSGYASTHIIPVVRSRPILAQATRLNWGTYHAAEYLLKLLRLKYPNFGPKMVVSQAEHMLRDFGYVSASYDQELAGYLDWTGLEDRDIVIQYPYTEEVVGQKTEEELARIADRKRESGRRLQEMAAKLRLERLAKKEEELEYYRKLQARLENEPKKEAKRLLDGEDFKDQAALDRAVRELDRAIRKARTKDTGRDPDEGAAAAAAAGEEDEPPVFDLVDTADDQLDEAGLRAKRQQRLMKANYEARARAKAEKEAEKARLAEEERLDRERREGDLDGWLADRRNARLATLQKMRERDRLRQDLGNRKTLASQMRMRNIANLASADNPSRKRRRGVGGGGGGGPGGGGGEGGDDDFGANDDDWGVYRSIAVGDHSDDEQEEEDLLATLRGLEGDLLRYDAAFTHEHTHEAQSDWSRSLVHAFLRGPRPFDTASAAEANQIHLNVERIRVPEVVFRPSIAGVDQAGIVEIVGDVLNQRAGGSDGGALRDELLRDVFLTGGGSLYANFDERMREGLTALLPAAAPLRVRRARDGVLDPWRGAAGWACGDGWRAGRVTREEYLERGAEYIKEHDLGTVYS